MTVAVVKLAELPGGDLLEAGLEDLARGELTVSALLVVIGSYRLRAAGVTVPEVDVDLPEHRLYDLLARDDEDGAQARYNALICRLVSLERALECVSE